GRKGLVGCNTPPWPWYCDTWLNGIVALGSSAVTEIAKISRGCSLGAFNSYMVFNSTESGWKYTIFFLVAQDVQNNMAMVSSERNPPKIRLDIFFTFIWDGKKLSKICLFRAKIVFFRQCSLSNMYYYRISYTRPKNFAIILLILSFSPSFRFDPEGKQRPLLNKVSATCSP